MTLSQKERLNTLTRKVQTLVDELFFDVRNISPDSKEHDTLQDELSALEEIVRKMDNV